MHKLLAAALLSAATAAFAQATLYKCGSTYSEKPCGPDAVEVRARDTAPPVPRVAVKPYPASTPAVGKEAQAYLDDRAKRIADRDAKAQLPPDYGPGERAREIQRANADPKRCSAIRSNMAARMKRDPLGASITDEMRELRMGENLYCGPSM